MSDVDVDADVDADVGVRIRAHPSLCSGTGECHRWAPDVYPLDDEGLIAVHLLSVPPERALHAWWGARACPYLAISVIGPPEEHWAEVEGRRAERSEEAHRCG